MARRGRGDLDGLPDKTADTRAAFIETYLTAGLSLTPVCRVSEVVEAEMTSDRHLLAEVVNGKGESWPALASPMRLSETPPVVHGAIGVPCAL